MCSASAKGLQAIAANLRGICRVCKGGARVTTDRIWSLRPQLTTFGHFWPHLTTSGHSGRNWPHLATSGHFWPLLATLAAIGRGGNCRREPCLQGSFNALQLACRGTAGKLQDNCKEDPKGICKGNARNLQGPTEEPQGSCRNVQRICKGPTSNSSEPARDLQGLQRRCKSHDWPHLVTPAATGHIWPLLAASDHIWPLLAAPSGHIWPSGHYWPLWPQLATSSHIWPRLATSGHNWPYLAIPGHIWPRLATSDLLFQSNQDFARTLSDPLHAYEETGPRHTPILF